MTSFFQKNCTRRCAMNEKKSVKEYEEIDNKTRASQDPAGFLNAALEQGIPVFLCALKQVVDVNGGPTHLSQNTGIHRTSIYKMLYEEGNPTMKKTPLILKIICLALVSVALSFTRHE